MKNPNRLNYKLATNFKGGKSFIPIHGLPDWDLIQYMGHMQMIECMNGFAWQITEGIIPFGSVKNQMVVSKTREKSTEDNFCTEVS